MYLYKTKYWSNNSYYKSSVNIITNDLRSSCLK